MSQNAVTVEVSAGAVGEGFGVVDGAGREDSIWEAGVRVAAGSRLWPEREEHIFGHP